MSQAGFHRDPKPAIPTHSPRVGAAATSSIADPNLTLTHEALKIFTAFFVLTGIGILVELARQLCVGFVKLREEKSATRHARHDERRARRHKDDPPETPAG